MTLASLTDLQIYTGTDSFIHITGPSLVTFLNVPVYKFLDFQHRVE